MTRMRSAVIRFGIWIMLVLMFPACSGRAKDLRPKGFKTDICLPTTPVDNQGSTPLCWIYAAVAAIETDRLAMGDSISISPQWIAHKALVTRLGNGGQQTFVGEKWRGTLPMALAVMEQHGIVTRESCATFPIQLQADSVREVPLPHLTFLNGATYTPKEYLHSCFLPGEWKTYGSCSRHEYGKRFVPDIPDNIWHQSIMNVPADSLTAIVVRSLRNRHPVMWEGCMANNLPADRTKAFHRGQLTDDHCMCIIGMGHDRKGTHYFIMKNSWGTGDAYHGFRFLSVEDFLKRTILIVSRIP